LSLPPAQGEERHECDIPGNALDQERLGGAVREAVGVLHTDDVGDLDRPVQVGEADVADPHTGNQALVASRGQRAKLIDESRVWDGVFGKPQASETEPCSNVTDCISSSSVLFGEVDPQQRQVRCLVERQLEEAERELDLRETRPCVVFDVVDGRRAHRRAARAVRDQLLHPQLVARSHLD